MTVEDIYQWVFFLLNKTQSGEITDTSFNQAMQVVNMELFRYETGMPESYQIGNPMPAVAWQLTNTISDDLRPFIINVPINKVGDYFPYPTDYAAFSSMYFNYTLNSTTGGNPTYQKRWVEPVSDSELRLRLISAIKMPTNFYPIAAWYNQGYKVYPDNINRIELTYLKMPRTPFRAFTQLANDQTQYDPANSIQLEYPETLHPNFAVRVAKYVGVNIREEELYAMMQQRKNEGN